MNEQIRELLKQASKLANTEDTKDFDRNFDMIVAEKFAELLIREYSYDVMNLHGAKPERVQYAAKCWGVEV